MKKKNENITTRIEVKGDLSKDPAVKDLIKRFDLMRAEYEDFRLGKVISFVERMNPKPRNPT